MPAARVRPRLATAWAALESALARRGAGWILLGLLALVYGYAYGHHPQNPGTAPATLRLGWWGWADQFAYWKSAAELAGGQLSAEHYHYPLGYPLLGALWWRLLPAHPFLVPDLLLVLAGAAAWWRLARTWLDRRLTLLTAIAFVWLHRDVLALTQVVPWNTIATQATLLAGLWVVTGVTGVRAVTWLTVLAVLTYLVRPGDAACFAPLLAWAVLRLPTWRSRLVAGAGGLAALALAVAAVAAVNLAVFGTRDTPYERMTWEAVGFLGYPLLHKVYGLAVDGGTFFGETESALLFRYPWLFLALPGAVWWVRRQGGAAVAALLALALNWGLYVSYNDFLPSAVYRFSLIHYLTWSFPVLFALAVAAVRHGWRGRGGRVAWTVSGLLAVLATGVTLEPRTLVAPVSPGRVDALPDVRPLWVQFPGEDLAKVWQLRIDGRSLAEAHDFQIPYVPSDLRLMLGLNARGRVLATLPEAGVSAAPRVGDFTWGWRWTPARW